MSRIVLVLSVALVLSISSLSVPSQTAANRIYGVGWYELGSAFFDDNIIYRSSVSGAVIMETRLGPLTIGGAFGSGSRGKMFISMGRIF